MNSTARLWLQIKSQQIGKAANAINENEEAQLRRLKRLLASSHCQNAVCTQKDCQKSKGIYIY